MTRRAFAAIGVVFPLLASQATPAAHRLDEYLQATRIALAPDHVTVELDLTPGADVAQMIFFAINTDRDGHISAREGAAYAKQVLRDLVLEVHGQRQELALLTSQFPSFEEMRAGEGTIRLSARTASLSPALGPQAIVYRNDHRPEMSVYLVNALLSATPAIVITDQNRDPRQQGIRLGFDVLATPASASWLPALPALGILFSALLFVGFTGHGHKSTRLAEARERKGRVR